MSFPGYPVYVNEAVEWFGFGFREGDAAKRVNAVSAIGNLISQVHDRPLIEQGTIDECRKLANGLAVALCAAQKMIQLIDDRPLDFVCVPRVQNAVGVAVGRASTDLSESDLEADVADE